VGKAKILAMVFLAALVMTVTPALAAGDTTTLTISVQGPEISMNLGVSPAEWQVQAPSFNATHNSPTYTLTNNGNVLVNTTIVGTNAIGTYGMWELSNTLSSGYFTLSWTATSSSGVISKSQTEFLTKHTCGNNSNGFTTYNCTHLLRAIRQLVIHCKLQ